MVWKCFSTGELREKLSLRENWRFEGLWRGSNKLGNGPEAQWMLEWALKELWWVPTRLYMSGKCSEVQGDFWNGFSGLRISLEDPKMIHTSWKLPQKAKKPFKSSQKPSDRCETARRATKLSGKAQGGLQRTKNCSERPQNGSQELKIAKTFR